MVKLTPEEYKEILLMVADGLRQRAEDHTIKDMVIDMENKITPVYEYGKREPVSLKSKGFRYTIDVEYLDPQEAEA